MISKKSNLQHVRLSIKIHVVGCFGVFLNHPNVRWDLLPYILNKRPWKAPPFPIKLMKLEIYKMIKKIYVPPKIAQKHSKPHVFSLETSGKYHFLL